MKFDVIIVWALVAFVSWAIWIGMVLGFVALFKAVW